MDSLTYDLNIKICCYLIPGIECNIKEFLTYKLISKYFYRLLNDKLLWKKYCENIGLKKLFPLYIIQNNITKKIIRFHQLKDIFFRYSLFLDIFNYDFLKKLPLCKFKSSKCINNMCGSRCGMNNHYIIKYITNSIMRGVDENGTPYILFVYKNLSSNELIYEFIYEKNVMYNKRLVRYLTFSGMFNKTYIGLLSFKQFRITNTLFYRKLFRSSYNYIDDLLEDNLPGIVKYNNETKLFEESHDELVSLYYSPDIYRKKNNLNKFYRKKEKYEFNFPVNKYFKI